jgi:hypothetical protein
MMIGTTPGRIAGWRNVDPSAFNTGRQRRPRSFVCCTSSRIMRKARLRPEYAHLYPEILPDVWLGAAGVALHVGRQQERAAIRSGTLGPGRLLSSAHFQFTAGRKRRAGWSGPSSRRGE